MDSPVIIIVACIIFIVIWFGPIIPGVIIAKKKNRSPQWFWFGIYPGAGFWVLIVMLALKPLKICENCKKKIPSGSKVCPYCAKEVTLAPSSSPEIKKIDEDKNKENKKSNKKVAIIVISVVVAFTLFIALVGSTMFTSVGNSFKNCIPYKHSIELIENNEEIRNYLGDDFEQTGMISGSLNISGNSSGEADFSYKIKGKNGISIVYVDACKENGIWIYNKINFYKEQNSSDVINLLENQ